MSETRESKLAYAQSVVEVLLVSVQPVFVPGTKLTFIARPPGGHDQDFMVTNDELGEVAALVERRRRAEG